MPKRAFIIHGWGSNPEGDWFPWLKIELEKKGFQVEVPAMPHTETPAIGEWVAKLAEVVGVPDGETHFVGHSIGCQTILRYFESIDARVGNCVLVAPWLKLSGLETNEEKEVARPWEESPIDFEKVRNNCHKFILIFSDDDPFVPAENWKLLEDNLGSEIVIESDKGHFTRFDDGITELPCVLEKLLKSGK